MFETFLGEIYDARDYASARRAGQVVANRLNSDVGLELNPLFKVYAMRLLPLARNRYGVDLRCEVIRAGDPL